MEHPDFYIDILTILLPVSALMLVLQTNPYHALVIRGILGAISALVYAILGAADVALTEALMGTMLAITLYVVAVRSSMVVRLGVLEDLYGEKNDKNSPFKPFLVNLQNHFRPYHLRLELLSYQSPEALENALQEKDIHGHCLKPNDASYETTFRIRRINEILQIADASQEESWKEHPLTQSQEKK